MLTSSEDRRRRIAANLKRWSARPIGQSNRQAIGVCLVMMLLLIAASGYSADATAAMRATAGLFAATHGALHMSAIIRLRKLNMAGMSEAAEALRSYRDPFRISNLDIAVAWAAFALVAPVFGWIWRQVPQP